MHINKTKFLLPKCISCFSQQNLILLHESLFKKHCPQVKWFVYAVHPRLRLQLQYMRLTLWGYYFQSG